VSSGVDGDGFGGDSRPLFTAFHLLVRACPIQITAYLLTYLLTYFESNSNIPKITLGCEP
jgi:hypothetical protein